MMGTLVVKGLSIANVLFDVFEIVIAYISLLSPVWMYTSEALIANSTQSPMDFKLPLSFLGTYNLSTVEFGWSQPIKYSRMDQVKFVEDNL